MTKLNFSFSQNLFQRYQDLWIRYYFKFVLPRVQRASLAGITLDLSGLPVKIRNRILNVGYEDQERKMCQDYLTPEDSILEIGGAIGFIGLYCQKNIGIRQYITVEANPMTAEILKKNYALNGLSPTLWNLALAKSEGRVQLNVGGDFWENSVVNSPERPLENTIDVPAMTLSGLLKKAGRPINVLIIDIEGAEQFIDFTEVPASIDKIIIELHPAVIGQEQTYDIISQLIGKGFRVAREEDGTFAFLRRKEAHAQAYAA